MFRRVLSTLGIFTGIYIVYIIVTGIFLFHFQQPNTEQWIEEKEMSHFTSNTIAEDRIALVQDRFESGRARFNLVENAKESLDISYYSIKDDISSKLFISSIIEAGNRGVRVRIVLDGIVNTFNKSLKEALYVFTEHPNIEFKYFEPFQPFKPWTWNHRFHDKLILADETFAMIGGRNIGDKYFGPAGYEGASNDRDVIIINQGENQAQLNGSVIHQIKTYYDEVWHDEYSKTPYRSLSRSQKKRAVKKKKELEIILETARKENPDLFDFKLDWLDFSFPVNKITFMHNSLFRLNSNPWIWKNLIALMEAAEESIYMESPYVIPTEEMMGYVNKNAITAPNIEIYTNSLASTPNLFAFSGYTKYRNEIAQSDVQLYEFQSQSESIHAKTFVFDNRISAIGSFNLDPRSTFLNTEVIVIIDSKEFSEHLIKESTILTKQESLKVNPDGTYDVTAGLSPEKVSSGKKVTNWLLSKLTSWFSYLL